VEINGELSNRRYLFSVRAGQILCGAGLSAGERPVALLAVTSPDSGLTKLNLEQLLKLADETPGAVEQQTAPALLALWLELFAQSISIGSGVTQPPVAQSLLPVKGKAELAAALADAHRTLLAGLEVWQNRESDLERERLSALAEMEPQLVHDSISVLGSVLTGEAPSPKAAAAPQQPLYAACKRVWQALKINTDALPAPVPQPGDREPLLALAYLARLRIRQVTLRGEWWRADHGPLVAYRKEDRRPVALLPSSPRSYELYDETQGTRERITKEVAQTLAAQAYTFYRRLPERPLKLWDLLAFGLSNTRSDMAAVAILGLGSGALATVPPIITGLLFDTVIPGAQRP
jgi:ATP-binding cassette subfamily C protein